MTLQDRYDRTILTVGPPHSGKSVFAYLLFKCLRGMGDDTALFDCDIFGPTFRVYRLASDDEDRHIYHTPNYDKLNDDIPLAMFESYIDLLFHSVREKGIIVLDGLGRHSDKTEALLRRAKCLAIVCKSDITEEEEKACAYHQDGSVKHPFELYGEEKEQVLRISTHPGEGTSEVNLGEFTAELYGLSRDAIEGGKIKSVPRSTCEQVAQMASFVKAEWF